MIQNPNASVPELMAAVQAFTAAEWANQSIQQRVCHAHKAHKATAATLPSSTVAPTNNPPNLSSVTDPSVLSSVSKNSIHSKI